MNDVPPPTPTPGDLLTLEIDAMAYGGAGVCRNGPGGRTVFVNGALPGDRVRVRLRKVKRRWLRGDAVEILSPGPERQPAPCPVAGECGGCPWMTMKDAQQQHWKTEFIRYPLRRFMEGVPLRFYPAPRMDAYRNRIRVHFGDRGQGPVAGFYATGSHNLVPVRNCLVALPVLNRVLAGLPAPDGTGFSLELQALPASGGVLGVIRAGRRGEIPDRSWVSSLKKMKDIKDVLLEEDLPGEFHTFAETDGITWHHLGGTFQQINDTMNRKVRDRVTEILRTTRPADILDLYCGNGNFSLRAALDGIRVLGIESSAPAIACAKHNTRVNGGADARWLVGDAGEPGPLLDRFNYRPDLVIADPPRSGMAGSLPALLKAAPRVIIYISCDPETLGRDLAVLSPLYEVKSVDGYDFFPHTWHVESLVLLQKRSPS